MLATPPPPVRPLSSPSGALVSACVRGLLAVLRKLPQGLIARLAWLLGTLGYALHIRRGVALDNLREAFPELSTQRRAQIARAMYVNMAQAALDGLIPVHLPVTFESASLEEAIAQRKGALIATAHFGSWELIGALLPQRGIPLNAVVRPLRGSLNAELMEGRKRSGLKLIPARGAIRQTIQALRRGEAVAVLVDQTVPAKQGLFVPFFGRLACTSPALSIAALRTGAPVFVAVALRDAGGVRVLVEGPIPVPAGEKTEDAIFAHTREVTRVLEDIIRKHPEQWLWLHRRWKVQPPVKC